MDLGVKQSEMDGPCCASSPVKKDKKDPLIYPSFDVREAVADELRKEYDCDVDKTGTAVIKFRISGSNKDKYSNRLSVEVQSIDDIQIEGSSDEVGEAEEKVIGVKLPKKSSLPDTSAADLEE